MAGNISLRILKEVPLWLLPCCSWNQVFFPTRNTTPPRDSDSVHLLLPGEWHPILHQSLSWCFSCALAVPMLFQASSFWVVSYLWSVLWSLAQAVTSIAHQRAHWFFATLYRILCEWIQHPIDLQTVLLSKNPCAVISKVSLNFSQNEMQARAVWDVPPRDQLVCWRSGAVPETECHPGLSGCALHPMASVLTRDRGEIW